MTPWQAELVHDRLHARCLVLDNETTKIAIAVCDSCMIPREIFDAAKRRRRSRRAFPPSTCFARRRIRTPASRWREFFKVRSRRNIASFWRTRSRKASSKRDAQREPGALDGRSGTTRDRYSTVAGICVRARRLTDPFDRGTDRVQMNPAAASPRLLKPAGPTDPEIPILAVQALGWAADRRFSELLAALCRRCSAPVAFRRLLWRVRPAVYTSHQGGKVEPPFVGIMSNGTSGDINNVNFFEGTTGREPFEQIRLVAADVAERGSRSIPKNRMARMGAAEDARDRD